jgi:hypothetical protein
VFIFLESEFLKLSWVSIKNLLYDVEKFSRRRKRNTTLTKQEKNTRENLVIYGDLSGVKQGHVKQNWVSCLR